MRIDELRQMARRAFGQNLEHATPGNVREFLDELHRRDWRRKRQERQAKTGNARLLDLDAISDPGGLSSWESQIRQFFNRSLDQRPEEAAAMLWLFALETAYSGIEEVNAETFNRLFQDEDE